MQKSYINLEMDDRTVHNGNYMLAVFHIVPGDGHSLLDIASEVAAESSTGSNIKVRTATDFAESLNALVYKIDEKENLVYMAYPWRIFDRVGNVQNVLTYVAGNVFGISTLKACKLLDVWFPREMLDQYDGPSYDIKNLREFLGKKDGYPILGTIIKPKIGLTPSEYGEVCYNFRAGGGDFVKNDEPQADQDFCPYDKMVMAVRAAMDAAEKETGQNKVHSFNVSAADYDTMIERCDFIIEKMKPGSYAFLIDGITAGWMAVQTLRRRYPEVFLHFHRAGHGAFTRHENPIGYSVPVLSKFARLAGASGIHTGTAGIGKMAGDVADDITSARLILNDIQQGPFFEQNRYGMLPTCPIISGGMNITKLPKYLDTLQDEHFITTMGAGIHSHPDGSKAGAAAVVQGMDAYVAGKDMLEYAQEKGHEELKAAIDFYSRKADKIQKELEYELRSEQAA